MTDQYSKHCAVQHTECIKSSCVFWTNGCCIFVDGYTQLLRLVVSLMTIEKR